MVSVPGRWCREQERIISNDDRVEMESIWEPGYISQGRRHYAAVQAGLTLGDRRQ